MFFLASTGNPAKISLVNEDSSDIHSTTTLSSDLNENIPHSSSIGRLGSKLVKLFGEIVATMGDRALLEKVHQWGWALSISSIA